MLRLNRGATAPTLLALGLLVISCLKASKTSTKSEAKTDKAHASVIYGTDNRHDLYQEPYPIYHIIADSTVALIKDYDLEPDPATKTVKISGVNFGKAYYLCADEPFRDQDTAAFCSGFLVASDLVMTAGHCIPNTYRCDETSFVFGFAKPTPNWNPNVVPQSDVYHCKDIIHTQMPANGADFAIIRLDRPVYDHYPTQLRTRGSITPGESVAVMGHPSGLPLKISGGAKVRALRNGFFVANLDTYGGNSGSLVFNPLTFDAEGILVRGERDFARRDPDGCIISNRCTDDGCRGEDVTSITEALKSLNSVQ